MVNDLGRCAGEKGRVQPTRASPTVAPMAGLRSGWVSAVKPQTRGSGWRRQRSNRRVKERAKRFSRSANETEGVRVTVSVRHLLGNGDNCVLHCIETDAGGAGLDPGSASRSGRALIPVQVAAGRAGLDPWRTVRVGDGPSSFLGWKHWKKPDNAFNYSWHSPSWEPRNPPF